jgi:GTP cyclohydrolase I
MQIAGCLQEHLRPKGVGVVVEAEHTCMSLRGVQKAGTRTTTSMLLGLPARRWAHPTGVPIARHEVT